MKEQLIAFDGRGNSDRILKRTVKVFSFKAAPVLRRGRMHTMQVYHRTSNNTLQKGLFQSAACIFTTYQWCEIEAAI